MSRSNMDDDERRFWRCFGGTCGGLALFGCPAGIVSLALNIWNIVICQKALNLGLTDDCTQSNLKVFLIGSIVCSAITVLGCGLTVPVPHLVFAILGHIWRSNFATLCSATVVPALLLSTVQKSVAVLFVTFAFNAALLIFICFAPCCVVGATLPFIKRVSDNV